MSKFPADAPKRRVLKALQQLGFRLLREKEYISMIRENRDGTSTPLTLPNHLTVKFYASLHLHAGGYFTAGLSESLRGGVTQRCAQTTESGSHAEEKA